MPRIEIDRDLVRTLREERRATLRKLKEIDRRSRPVFNDPDYLLLTDIFDIFRSQCGCGDGGIPDVYERKKFLFVCLFLYSPRTFHGSKIRSGLRDRILALLGVSCRTAISDNCRNIMALYDVYRDFRIDVDRTIAKIYEKYPDRFRTQEKNHLIKID